MDAGPAPGRSLAPVVPLRAFAAGLADRHLVFATDSHLFAGRRATAGSTARDALGAPGPGDVDDAAPGPTGG